MSPSARKTPLLVVVSAPSGAGKTTLCQRLLGEFPELTLSISSTTRLPRGTESHGKEYFFLSEPAFRKLIKMGELAEWAEVHGNLYGTSRTAIDGAFAAGKSVLLDIDVQGAKSLREAYPDRSLLLFVSPPSLQELEFRLRARGTDTEDSVQRRLQNAHDEMKAIASFDHVIVNDDLERAYQEASAIVRAALRAGSTERASG